VQYWCLSRGHPVYNILANHSFYKQFKKKNYKTKGNQSNPERNSTTTQNENNTNYTSQHSIQSIDPMQNELKHVLTLFREKRRNLEIIKTPEIYIQQNSNSNEVNNWLTAKGFSANVVNNLKGFNANELFALQRHHLEEICGLEEGKRLASQITVQRNVSGYKTARSSELQAILKRAREKSEQQPKMNQNVVEKNLTESIKSEN